MYFLDLSTYHYSVREPLHNVLNVGWLDQSMPFSNGIVPASFLERLENWFSVGRVNQMRGIHKCNLCRVERRPLFPIKDNPSISLEGRSFFLGNWEIWIPGPSETIFASPALIIHYVNMHGYQPPAEFIAAVMNDKAMDGWSAGNEFTKRTILSRT
jgi:hypothetical protein